MSHICNGYHIPILSVLEDTTRGLLNKLGFKSATFPEGRKFIFEKPLETCCPIDILRASICFDEMTSNSSFASQSDIVYYQTYVQFSFYGKNASEICTGMWNNIESKSANIDFKKFDIKIVDIHTIRVNPQLIEKGNDKWEDSYNFDLILSVPIKVKTDLEKTQYIASNGEIFTLTHR